MYFDLSGYIDYLEARGELVRINEYVNPELEIAEITDRISKTRGGGKALLFLNTGTPFPVLMNAMGSDSRIAYALGVNDLNEIPKEIDDLFKEVMSPKLSLWEKLKMLPTLKQVSDWMPKNIKTKSPACQEVVMPSPKLSDMPILKCWTYDGGRFITLPLVHTKDAETGLRNVGMYRIQVYEDALAGMHWHRHKTGARHFETYREKGQLMPIAITLGGDPAYTWCATSPLPENLDEYLLAGFLRKRPVRLVKCLTQDIEVPEDSDFVIEGYIDPNEAFVSEGPFGDHTGYYSLKDLYPKMHITCITHRKGAVYPATVVGIPPQEDAYIAKAIEKVFLKPIQLVIAPEVTDMFLPEQGVTHNIAIISINKSYPGQAIKIANAMWGAGQMMFSKLIVVVDSDINIRSINDVLDAVIKYWNPSVDTHFGRGPLDVLDHAARQAGFGGKMCIDATRKMLEEEVTTEATPEADKAYVFYNEDKIPQTNAKLKIMFDAVVDVTDFNTCIWIAGNNVDVSYDCKIENNSLLIDATTKFGHKDFHRPWPNIVCMDDETIKSVDEKWGKLNLGRFIPSPSLKYKYLVKSKGAQIELP